MIDICLRRFESSQCILQCVFRRARAHYVKGGLHTFCDLEIYSRLFRREYVVKRLTIVKATNSNSKNLLSQYEAIHDGLISNNGELGCDSHVVSYVTSAYEL